mgnify:CR=1 FL=1
MKQPRKTTSQPVTKLFRIPGILLPDGEFLPDETDPTLNFLAGFNAGQQVLKSGGLTSPTYYLYNTETNRKGHLMSQTTNPTSQTNGKDQEVKTSGVSNQTQIPGVPLGAKIVRIGKIEYGEFYVNGAGRPQEAEFSDSAMCNVVVAPDNPYGKFLHEVEADIKAAGGERLGGDDYRYPRSGEDYWASGSWGRTTRVMSGWDEGPRLILKPLKPKTFKVLVGTHNIYADGTVSLPGASYDASSLVRNYPGWYREEERLFA